MWTPKGVSVGQPLKSSPMGADQLSSASGTVHDITTRSGSNGLPSRVVEQFGHSVEQKGCRRTIEGCRSISRAHGAAIPSELISVWPNLVERAIATNRGWSLGVVSLVLVASIMLLA
jgi:hypothetical protein